MKSSSTLLLGLLGLLGLFGLLLTLSSCDEFQDPPPTAPVVAPIPPSRYTIAGAWDGVTQQGRPLRFEVTEGTVVVNGTLSLHHDCSGGRLVLEQLGVYEAQVNGDSFSITINWRRDEDRRYYVGTLTVSGRFEGDRIARGGFVNSITDKVDDNLGVCPSASGSWEASRE